MRNVGEDKDSDDRQIAKCVSYANTNNIELIEEGSGNNRSWVVFYDEGVSGTTDIMERKEFQQLHDYCVENAVDYILVEDISRFSRDAIKSELGRSFLQRDNIDILPVNAPDLFLNDDKTDPTRRFIRLVLAGIADLERNQIALRLASGRRKKRKLKKDLNAKGEGKCGGPRGWHEDHPEIPLLIHQLKEKHPKGSLRFISNVAYGQGIKNKENNPFSASQIRRFLNTPKNILTKEVN